MSCGWIISSRRTLLAIAGSAFTLVLAPDASAAQIDKEWAHSELRALALEIDSLKPIPGNEAAVAELRERYAALSARLGGDEPTAVFAPAQSAGGFLTIPPDPPGSTTITTNVANTTPTPILDSTSNTSTILVAGLGANLWDVDLTTAITHTFAGDLDIRLTSPMGTVVVVSTDNGGSFDNVFNGTLFDDQQATPVSDWLYVNLVTAGPLTPEGAFGRFVGEDPNGLWMIDVADDAAADVGSYTWSLDLTTIDQFPVETASSFAQTTPTPIVDNSPDISMLDVSGVGAYLCDLNLTTSITHTFGSDLDIRLTSPTGTVVVVSTDNGGSFDNVFNGTVFDDKEATPVTDWLYVNLVTAGPMTPEGAFGLLLGEDANGTWSLDVADDAGADVGSFTWQLDFETCGGSAHPPQCFGDAGCPCGNNDNGGGGCANSLATGAVLAGSGDASSSADTLVLSASGTPNQPGIFFQGDIRLGPPPVFGDGLRCCGQNVVRIGTYAPSGNATDTDTGNQIGGIGPPISAHPGNAGLGAGEQRCYQWWYRDPVGGPCGGSFNLSNAVKVTWLP